MRMPCRFCRKSVRPAAVSCPACTCVLPHPRAYHECRSWRSFDNLMFAAMMGAVLLGLGAAIAGGAWGVYADMTRPYHFIFHVDQSAEHAVGLAVLLVMAAVGCLGIVGMMLNRAMPCRGCGAAVRADDRPCPQCATAYPHPHAHRRITRWFRIETLVFAMAMGLGLAPVATAAVASVHWLIGFEDHAALPWIIVVTTIICAAALGCSWNRRPRRHAAAH